MILKHHRDFEKHLRKLSIPTQEQVVKAIALFRESVSHPSLNYERVGKKKHNLYTIRANQSDRILLVCLIANEFYTVLDVGSHDYIYRKVDRMK